MSANAVAFFIDLLFTDLWAVVGQQSVLDDVDRFYLRRCCRTLYADAELRRRLFPGTCAMESGKDDRHAHPRWLHRIAARAGRADVFAALLADRVKWPIFDDYGALVTAAMHSGSAATVCALTTSMLTSQPFVCNPRQFRAEYKVVNVQKVLPYWTRKCECEALCRLIYNTDLRQWTLPPRSDASYREYYVEWRRVAEEALECAATLGRLVDVLAALATHLTRLAPFGLSPETFLTKLLERCMEIAAVMTGYSERPVFISIMFVSAVPPSKARDQFLGATALIRRQWPDLADWLGGYEYLAKAIKDQEGSH